MTFNPLVPTGLLNLDVDYANLQQNFQASDNSFGVDHKKFSDATAQNGYHTNIHMVPFALSPGTSYPTPTGGYGQIFSNQTNAVNVDEALFFLSGGGVTTQITGNFAPVRSSNGYTSINGGLILQWGGVTPLFKTNAVTYASSGNIAFPNNTLFVVMNLISKVGGTTSDHTISLVANSSTATGFTANYSGGGSSPSTDPYLGFTWVAIGY